MFSTQVLTANDLVFYEAPPLERNNLTIRVPPIAAAPLVPARVQVDYLIHHNELRNPDCDDAAVGTI